MKQKSTIKEVLDMISRSSLSNDLKRSIMKQVASGNTAVSSQDSQTALDTKQLKPTPILRHQVGLELPRLPQAPLEYDHQKQVILAELCIRISFDVKWPNDPKLSHADRRQAQKAQQPNSNQ